MHRESLRAEFSRAMAAFAKPGLPNQHNPQMQPSSITKSLLARRAPDINRLVNLPNYDEQTVSALDTVAEKVDSCLSSESLILRLGS